ncbi:class I SAM-dependent methyltransferase [Candidatus Gottesmanbacteria bacterium]|nr:class I SAM-dependent methyltransferase [Candidatus Gottesmanbacteria bacterium]
MKCLCRATEATALFTAGVFPIVRCCACGQVRTETPRGVVRKQVYRANDADIYVDKEAMFRRLFRDVVNFISQFQSSGTLVDIGAGVGLLVDEARRAGYEAVGLEPSKEMVRAAKKFFGVSLIPSKFSRHSILKARGKVDIIVLNHVLEHLPKPVAILQGAWDVLNPEGLLVIGVPNFGSFLAGWKKDRWQSLIPDQHRWHFTLRSLDRLTVPLGYMRIGMRQENHERSIHYWWKRPLYWLLDMVAIWTGKGEAMLIVYKKI